MREIVLDTETTGLDPYQGHKIVEIGCVELINRVRTGEVFQTYVNPMRGMPKTAYGIHGISEEFLKDKPTFAEIASDFLKFINKGSLIIHNARFDMGFLNFELEGINKPNLNNKKVVDTLLYARKKFPGSPASLDALCRRFKVDLSARDKHGALLDSELLAEVYIHLTGGRQSSMDFSRKLQAIESKKTDVITVETKTIETRMFKVSDTELENHKQVLAKITKPVWAE
jgi:DNA polymerase III subunit epsilon